MRDIAKKKIPKSHHWYDIKIRQIKKKHRINVNTLKRDGLYVHHGKRIKDQLQDPFISLFHSTNRNAGFYLDPSVFGAETD